jgi:hypothetical protein
MRVIYLPTKTKTLSLANVDWRLLPGICDPDKSGDTLNQKLA